MPYNVPSDAIQARAAERAQASTEMQAPTYVQAAAVALAASEIAATRQALLGSERAPIEACLARLERAAAVFQDAFQDAFQGMTRPAPASAPSVPAQPRDTRLRRDLTALRKDLAVVAGLAQSGAALYQGLARLLGAAAGGYTPQGDGAPLQPSVGVAVRG